VLVSCASQSLSALLADCVHAQVLGVTSEDAKALRQAVAPVVEWLQEAEEDESNSDEADE